MNLIPITIISGFLGAGKTSLLTHILNADHGKRVAVLVNDFGKLNIDSEVIVAIEGETVSLTNGCICCTMRDDMLTEVLKLLEREQVPEHIIIETSGVSDPTLVAHTFQMRAIQGVVEVDSIISVVDADQILSLDEEFHDLSRRQIRVADLIIVNKIDLIEPTQLVKVKNHVRTISPDARMIDAVMGGVDLSILLGTSRFSNEKLKSFPDESIGTKFSTWSYSNERPFTFLAIRKALEEIPKEIYRVKGFILLEGAPEDQGQFQMTGGRAWLRLGKRWESTMPLTRLVFIGKTDADIDAINAHFDYCQSEYSREKLDQRKEPVLVENHRALSILFG